MLRFSLPVIALAACTFNRSEKLQLTELDRPVVTISALNDPTGMGGFVPSSIEVGIDNADGGCARIADDVIATVDGQPLGGSRGGWNETVISSDCDAVHLGFVTPTLTSPTHIVITDHTATWTIDVSRLYANDLVLDAPDHVTWQSASAIDSATAQLTASDGTLVWDSVANPDTPYATVAIAGPALTITEPAPSSGVRTLAVSAVRTLAADRCDGPATCTVEARAGREFPLE